MKKRKLLMTMVVAVIAITLYYALAPKHLEYTMTASTVAGDTAVVEINIMVFPNFILPSYVKGTISVDGVAYTDQYTKLKEFPYVSDNHLLPPGWWKPEWWKLGTSLPYNMAFLKSECTDVIKAMISRLEVLDVEFQEHKCKIHYICTDESDLANSTIAGVSFFGPAANAEEAKEIAEYFGYSALLP